MGKTLKQYFEERLEQDNTKKITEAEETIKNEQDFREYAKKKFEEAFGEDLDEQKMKDTIDGILDDNKDLVDNDEWGELVGILNQSFAPKEGGE